MSFFDDASLVMIPSGYKDQKVYSVKPTDGTGDLTFSRASSATRVQSDGLIEKVRTNLVLYSEQLNNSASWGFEELAVTANAVANPLDGAVTADKIYATVTGSSVPILKQTVAASANQTITVSGYFKKLEYNFVVIHGFGLGGTIFNLDAGTKSGAGSITSVGNGWFRCAAILAMSGDSRTFITPSVDGSVGYISTANSGIYAFGVQIEISDFGATPYIATTTAAVSVGPVSGLPRLDYLGSTCPRLLLEPQRSNVLTFSEQLNNAAWGNAAAVTANSVVSPDGYTNADTVTGNLSELVSYTSGTAYTFSVFAKKNSGSTLSLRVDATAIQTCTFNLDTIVAGSGGTMTNYGNGWYRCAFTFTANATATGVAYILPPTSVYLYGCQLETGAYATSYIPTLGASVTRVAESAVKASVTSLIGQTEGTIFMDAVIDAFPTDNSFFGVEKTASSFVIRFGSGGSNVYAQVYNGTTNLFFEPTAYTLGTRVKLAFAYKAGSYAFYKNGTLVATGTTATTIPACDSIMTNSLWGNTGNGKHGISQALLFTTRLTNVQLAELTA